MEINHEETLNALYNLILNPATREWERSLLQSTKDALDEDINFEGQLSKLEADLRPLALRENLTPDVMDFYNSITGNPAANVQFDFTKHSLADLTYQDSVRFAGGCFWCMVEPFETLNGIVSVLSGYTGGHTDHPTYEQVIGRHTGHAEAVEIIFDTRIIQYKELVELYWQLTDPTDEFGQFQDRGSQYRPIIFVQNEQQRQIAEKSKQRLMESGKYKRPIVTTIEPANVFWPAENYHQQFYKKNRKRYKRIGRARQRYLAYQQLQGKIRTKLNRSTKHS
ncbi:peptide-methionine (S)-S-oxide reductase MsrA [Carnobacterium mobile]|uniref:peptide-methionine (S)-S-oxide reductase MsrA n=1 Tax=Carnobacterium mobile TaxID=2750 RepID=UPI00054E9D75|nr:peptide-methionine (S)-S-oxide reductase MsrA [Carnobacterium mobile]